MTTVVETFRELHRLRRLARDLEAELADAPRQLAAQQARLAKAEQDLQAAQDGLKHAKVTVSDKEKTLKSTHQQIAKYEKQRESATSKKEFDAFDHEIAHAKQKCAELEDEILAGLSDIDDRTAALPEIERELARVREETLKFQGEAEERRGFLQRELERAKTELAAAEATLPEDIRSHYQRLVASYGAEALAKVENRTCQQCYGSITLQMDRELGAGRFVTCKGCGRALYV